VFLTKLEDGYVEFDLGYINQVFLKNFNWLPFNILLIILSGPSYVILLSRTELLLWITRRTNRTATWITRTLQSNFAKLVVNSYGRYSTEETFYPVPMSTLEFRMSTP
jgi:hypothetical protein